MQNVLPWLDTLDLTEREKELIRETHLRCKTFTEADAEAFCAEMDAAAMEREAIGNGE